MVKALIDGDIIVYSCGFAAQKTYYVVNGNQHPTKKSAKEECDRHGQDFDKVHTVQVVAEDVSHALHNAKLTIEKCYKAVHATDYQVYLTGKNNFRDDLVDYYKANRDETHKPVHYQALIDYLINVHGAVTIDGAEADDAMGMAQWSEFVENPDPPYKTAICTLDKDLDMIPGLHYNWRKNTVYRKSLGESLYFFYTQVLTGDPVDNIKGVPGVGKVSAAAILHGSTSEKEMFLKCFGAYYRYIKRQTKKDGITAPVSAMLQMTDKLMKENIDLLWIMREDEPYKPPKMEPPTLDDIREYI